MADPTFFPEFKPAEIAILNFASDPVGRGRWVTYLSQGVGFGRRRYPMIVADKHAMIWAVTIAQLATLGDAMSEDQIRRAWVGAWETSQHLLLRKEELSLDINQAHYMEKVWFSALYDGFIKHTNLPDALHVLNDVPAIAREAQNGLVLRGLIKDPVALGLVGLPVALLGFVPYRFNRKTPAGLAVELKIETLYWTYSRKISRGTVKSDTNFRVVKFLKVFRKALRHTFADEVE